MTNTLLSLITVQGTAAAEATLCVAHLLSHRAEVEASADADVVRPGVWADSTDNEAVACVVCSA